MKQNAFPSHSTTDEVCSVKWGLPPAEAPRRHGAWRHLALLVLFPVLFELPLVFRFGALMEGDAELVQKIALVSHLKQGLPVVWTEMVDCGTTFFGSTNASISPWDVLYFFANPFWVANISFISYLVLGGIGFFLWRVRCCRSAPFAALFGALLYQGASYALVNTSIGHETLMQPYAWFPWALWLVDLLAERRRWIFFALFPWIIFGMSLNTYPLMTWMLGLMLAARLGWQLVGQRSTLRRVTVDGLILLGATALGLGFFAFFCVPAQHFAQQAVAPGHPDFNFSDYRYHITWPVTHLITLLNPYFFGDPLRGTFWSHYLAIPNYGGGFHEYTIYVGLMPLALIWMWRRKMWAASEGRFWLGVLAVFFVISLGKWGGLYPLLARLPVIDNFRGPARYTIAWPIVASILSCLALEQNGTTVGGETRLGRATVRWTLAALILAMLWWAAISVFAAYVPWTRWVPQKVLPRALEILKDDVLPSSFHNVLIVAVLALGMGGIWFGGLWARIPRTRLLLAMLLFDLAWTGWIFAWRPSYNYASYGARHPVGSYLREQTRATGERVMDLDYALPVLRSLQDGFPQIDGYKPLHLAWYQEFINQLNAVPIRTYDTYDYRAKNPNSPLLPFLRVRYIVSNGPRDIPHASLAAQFGKVHVYRTSQVLPLFYATETWQKIPDKIERLAFIERSLKEGRMPMVVERIPQWTPRGDAPLQKDLPGLDSANSHDLVHRVHLPSEKPCLLGSSLAWSDEWRAFDQDGHPLVPLRVNHAFLGVDVPSGTREVVLRFNACHHRLGLELSAGSLLAYAAGLWVLRGPSRRRGLPAPDKARHPTSDQT